MLSEIKPVVSVSAHNLTDREDEREKEGSDQLHLTGC